MHKGWVHIDSVGAISELESDGAAHLGKPALKNSGLREGLLADVPLVEPRTLQIQDKVWEGFLGWMRKTLSAMAQPALLVYLAKEYGSHLYSSGKSLFVFRNLLVFLQQNFVTVKPHMGGSLYDGTNCPPDPFTVCDLSCDADSSAGLEVEAIR